jgi:homoserine O-succinyltransferase
MTSLLNRHRSIASPALVPGDHAESGEQVGLRIGLVNNMPDTALKATERQFMQLVRAAAGNTKVRFHRFSLPSVGRTKSARQHVAQEYDDIARLDSFGLDGLIVTGAEPNAATLPQEPFWHELTRLIDWAKTHTRSAMWSCLAAHAAVLHLDGIERHRLHRKCSGVFDCVEVSRDWLTRGATEPLKVSHSRFNAVGEAELATKGYRIVTRSADAGVDIFTRRFQSQFVFLQGHPEYDALSLQREYMRDIARYLSGECDAYPDIPACYFDAETEDVLMRFEQRARTERNPTLAAELPGLTLRADHGAGSAASVIFGNWVRFLLQGAAASLPAR